MIVRDFNWDTFNRSRGVSFWLSGLYLIYVALSQISFFKQFQKDLVDIKFLSWLGAESHLFVSFLGDIFMKFRSYFLGQTFSDQYDNSLLDITGKIFYDDEIFLFDYETHLLRESMTYSVVDAKDLASELATPWFSSYFDKPLFNSYADPSAVTWFYNERLVSYSLYHYTAVAFFFNGRVNKEKFGLRKVTAISDNSDLGLFQVLSLLVSPKLRISPVIKSGKTSNYNILLDTLFESVDFKHSLSFEFIWALFPTVIIISILVPSLYLLYSLDEDLDPKFTIKVIGNQWYWSYEFNNWVEMNADEVYFWNYKFDSNLITMDNLEFGTKRLLEVDNRLVLPINVTLRFLITAGDVLHSWAVPELGVKIDAVPGRLNQFLAFITRPGVFYGQCSEICGANHGFMPIVIVGVHYDVFTSYLVESFGV
jgi:cytochrome c oxidase subunit 2